MNLTKTIALVALTAVAACSNPEAADLAHDAAPPAEGVRYKVAATTFAEVMWVPAQATPIAQAMLSTKLMGTVTAVHVHEGDQVRAGQPIVTIDARDLAARDAQARAAILEVEAMRGEAVANANRMRALFAEEAATRAQLDAAETALARAEAGVRAANATRSELSAARSYAVVRAPFDGLVTARMVDPGAFATPGAPLAQMENARQLRVTGSAAPEAIRTLRRGAQVQVRIESTIATGTVEAVVPSGGNLYHINVIVNNADGAYLSGAAAAIALPQASRAAIRVPVEAVQHIGDLTGVRVVTGSSTSLRWVQLGATEGQEVEVLTGLRVGDEVLVPRRGAGAI
jgi:RND family efflux transporter MFP subunit